MLTASPEADSNVFVPKFKTERVDLNGRQYGLKKIPQTSMFAITAEGSGDLPARLKGNYTSIREASKQIDTYLDNERKEAKAAAAPKLDVFTQDTPKEDKPEKSTLSLKGALFGGEK